MGSNWEWDLSLCPRISTEKYGGNHCHNRFCNYISLIVSRHSPWIFKMRTGFVSSSYHVTRDHLLWRKPLVRIIDHISLAQPLVAQIMAAKPWYYLELCNKLTILTWLMIGLLYFVLYQQMILLKLFYHTWSWTTFPRGDNCDTRRTTALLLVILEFLII